MSTAETTHDRTGLPGGTIARDRARELLGQVMGLVALTVVCAALGAYVGRDLGGVAGLLLFIPALGCVVGLNLAAARGAEQLALGLLFGLGLLLGLAVAPVIAVYADADPAALWQAAGATALFVAAGRAEWPGRRRYDRRGDLPRQLQQLPAAPPAVRRPARLLSGGSNRR